ncbi:FAD-dependent oxidoreductase [Arcanobacterium ihumii]|uniref:FAD-dependent oxidoreductase n=1 Tax=Arcanobacterium ihumii TaxID=2138162 RepID=UPI000F531FF6|nr:FAD-dependent oxidoreductase [Arcanobacterium ihumii]
MAEEYDFDVIVVGGGISGSVCAYSLAKEGHEVLLIERGVEPGSKNLSGGIFYSRVMEQVFPNFTDEAPVERVITRNTLSFMNEESVVNVDYWDKRLAQPINAVSVLRAKLDPWLTEQCEDLGVTVMPGIKVDELISEDGHFVGVRAGDESLRARIVVAADGVNSFLSQYAGIRGKEPASHLGVGVKSVIRIGEEKVKERFNLSDNEGAAYAIVGDCTQGVAGGGFMYTNKDSISIGVVMMLEDLKQSGLASADIHDHFLTHPFIAPFLQDGELLEYGCHLVAEGGKAMQHDLVRNGLVVIGDAAGFTLNTGLTVRGMDLAAQSAVCASKVISSALAAEDYSQAKLEAYVSEYEQSWLGKDMETFQRAPHFLETTKEMYGDVGKLLADTFFGVYNLDLTPRKRILPVAWGAFKKSKMSMVRLVKIAINAVRAM